MKIKNRILKVITTVLTVCIAGGVFFVACNNNKKRGEEIAYQIPTFKTYKNHIEIEGQWGASRYTGENGQYGIGDPFVMRYNGKYYMYPSTSDPCDGIKVFESEDLVNWTYKGFAVAESEPTVHGAYAPEVVYYNGYFYMCQSRAGKGHYIYRSESPTEGFTLISKSDNIQPDSIDYGNLGMGIDGAFYVDDNGKLYIMHTVTAGGLKYNEITDVNDIKTDTIGVPKNLGMANLIGWIEGPGVFRRGSYSYLTYTGNHVISKGYRVGYSYAENLKSLGDFIQPTENITLIDTDPDHLGLGHSSNTNGPNLDSIYTAYHSYVGGGPQRRYNVDRYYAFGGMVTANGVTHRPVAVPEKADFKADDASGFTSVNGIYALGQSDSHFTAEYNFIPQDEQRAVFGSNGNQHYEIAVKNGKVSLFKVVGSNSQLLGEKQVYIANGKLCTIRVENGDGVGYVYYNGMQVISYSAEGCKGYIGYTTKNGVYHTSFTNDVFGTSDFESIKNFPLTFPAVTYLKGENRGFSILDAKTVKGGVRVGEKQNISKISDCYAVNLKEQDWIKYAVDVYNADTYLLGAKISTSSKATLKITIGDSVLQCKVDGSGSVNNGDGESVNVVLGNIDLKAGVQTMKVEVVEGSASILSFTAEEGANINSELNLTDFVKQSGNADISNDSITVYGGNVPGAVIWGSKGLSNFELSFDFKINAGMGANLGVMLRAKNYTYYGSQPSQSWQGYYCSLQPQTVSVKRYDYSEGFINANRTDVLNDGNTHSLKITVNNNVITIVVDGKQEIVAKDDYAFYSGYIGFYALSGDVTVTNLNFKTI